MGWAGLGSRADKQVLRSSLPPVETLWYLWYGGAIQTVDWQLVWIGEGGSAFVSDSGDIVRTVRMARVASVEN